MTCNYDCFSPLIPLYTDLAQVIYVANGSTTDYQFTFDYLDKDAFDGSVSRYVRVWVGNDKDDVSERTDFTMPNASTVRLSPAPTNGHYILIRRDSKPDEQVVDFTDPNVTSADLDLGYKHNLYLVQEIFDKLGDVQCRLDSICGTSNENNGGPVYTFHGDCSTTAFELDNEAYGEQTDLGEEDILLFINGILQPPSAYQIDNSSGTSTVTLDVAPTNTDTLYIKVISNARIAYRVVEGGIADGAITTNKLANGAVTLQKTSFGGSNGNVLKNVSGTWTPSTVAASEVTSFDTQVRTNRLDQLTAPTGSLSLNSQKITNLANGSASTDAAAYGQVSALSSSITALQTSVTGGYTQGQAGIMPDLYFRANYMTTRDAAWNSFYPGVVPQVATASTRHATQLLMTGFVPRRMKILIAGAIRRNASSTIIHSHNTIERVIDFVRWDDDSWYTLPNTGTFTGQYKTYTLQPRNVYSGNSSDLSNITLTLEIDFTNAKTWLYIYGSGFGSELMRLTSYSDNNTVGVIQVLAERGY